MQDDFAPVRTAAMLEQIEALPDTEDGAAVGRPVVIPCWPL